MTTIELLNTYWPHASLLATGLVARPTWRRARAGVVLLARAIVAHEDGDDVTALADVKELVAEVAPLARHLKEAESIIHLAEAAKQSAAQSGVKSW